MSVFVQSRAPGTPHGLTPLAPALLHPSLCATLRLTSRVTRTCRRALQRCELLIEFKDERGARTHGSTTSALSSHALRASTLLTEDGCTLCVLQAPPPLNLIHKLLFLPTYICLRAVCGRCWAKWCVVHPTHLSTCAAHLCTERIVPMVGTGGLRSRRRQHMALRRRSASRSRSDCKHVSSGLRESSSVTALTKMHTPPS